MATDAPPPQPESGHVHAAIPEAVTALSAARTNHTKPYRAVIRDLTKIPMNHEAPLAA